jgi:hypothetical protein
MPRRDAVERNRLLSLDKAKLRYQPIAQQEQPTSPTAELSTPPSNPLPVDDSPTDPVSESPEPECPYKPTFNDTITVLGLVRQWELQRIILSEGSHMADQPDPLHGRASYFPDRYGTVATLLDDPAPMTLDDATKLWTSLLSSSSLNWHRRGGLKKDYKRWTYKWWAFYKRGPVSLTVDARGSEQDGKRNRLEPVSALVIVI